jgi:hypothetical protein
MTDQQDAPESAPVFPTVEGGAVPAEDFFDGTMWHFLLVVDMTLVPEPWIRESVMRYLTRTCYEFIGAGKYSVWNNIESVAVHAITVPGKMDLFQQRVKESVELWTKPRTIRMNRFTMTLQKDR